jgi:tetratricopeptide (TPR) repeat protein
MTQTPATAVDLSALWDFNQPAVSEQRFQTALASAQGDEVLILQTQTARTWGLRRDFERARTILAGLEPQLPQAGAEARVRHALEFGRTWASPKHSAEQQDDTTRARARQAFEQALSLARSAQLDALAIDAVHMLAFVDTAPADQLKWAQQALALSLASKQPAAQRWEASIRNNLGYALHQLDRYDEALAELQKALALRQARGPSQAEREARWMVAWTLRSLERHEEALAMQRQLEADNDAAGTPDGYVFEELETLYRARGDTDRAAHYAARRAALKP